MSRLLIIDPDTSQDPEPEGHKYGYCIFEELPSVSTKKRLPSTTNVTLNDVVVFSTDHSVGLLLNIICKQLPQLQQEDHFCKRIISLLESSKLQANNPYHIEDKLLMRNIIDNKQCFHAMVLPLVLTNRILRAAHDELGHNGKCLKISSYKHIKQCMTCQKRNIQAIKYAQLHFPIPRLPMQLILMDLISPFYPSSGGYHYTFTW